MHETKEVIIFQPEANVTKLTSQFFLTNWSCQRSYSVDMVRNKFATDHKSLASEKKNA